MARTSLSTSPDLVPSLVPSSGKCHTSPGMLVYSSAMVVAVPPVAVSPAPSPKPSVRWVMKTAGFCLTLGLYIGADVGCVTSQSLPPPAGWRNPTSAEMAQRWRNDDPARYLAVRADFNGDQVIDEARLIVKIDGTGLALVVFLSTLQDFTTSILDQIDEPGWLDVMGISLASPGKYKTACGKGYVECEPGEAEELILQRPGINYFKEEGANSFFYWDDQTAYFSRVWMSD